MVDGVFYSERLVEEFVKSDHVLTAGSESEISDAGKGGDVEVIKF